MADNREQLAAALDRIATAIRAQPINLTGMHITSSGPGTGMVINSFGPGTGMQISVGMGAPPAPDPLIAELHGAASEARKGNVSKGWISGLLARATPILGGAANAAGVEIAKELISKI